MKIYLVKSEFGHDTKYHTGEFSREDPPSAYIGDIEDAIKWKTFQAAKNWVELFGGEVVELDEDDINKTETLYATECQAIERDGDDCVITLRIKQGKAFAGGWSLNDKFSIIKYE
jgi:hypothetical protein